MENMTAFATTPASTRTRMAARTDRAIIGSVVACVKSLLGRLWLRALFSIGDQE